MLKLKATDHAYYCSTSNYRSNSVQEQFNSWNQFIECYADADIDMNYVFRYDIYQTDDQEYRLYLSMIRQRLGDFVPIIVKNLKESDMKDIQKYLEKYKKRHKEMWKEV